MLPSSLSLILATSLVAQSPQGGGNEWKGVLREITPSATDSRIDTFTANEYKHCVYWQPSAKRRKQLVVFLPGTGGNGHNSVAFNRLAADLGYHVVSLSYPSDISMSVFHASTDEDAFLKARENILYGKSPLGNLKVNETNSIHNRLVKLLVHLHAKYPKEGWGQYLSQEEPVWEKLVLTGQSQGGGHAALLAMQHRVARVLMFGSPKDFNIHFNKPAKWFEGPNATPIDRYFSLVHRLDEGHGCTYAQQLENYKALKLSPRYPVIDVDKATPPYRHSRLLTSSITQENPHGAVIGFPRFYAKAWNYMLQEETER